MMRFCWMTCIVFAGCHLTHPAAPNDSTALPPTAEAAEIVPVRHEEPVEEDGLSHAAQHLEAGRPNDAIFHLRQHIQRNPDQVMIRAYLAELLMKVGKWSESAQEFERFISDAQSATGSARKHLVHCHTRLMEIAQQRQDRYGEHLHRGIGLVLLARHQVENPGTANADLNEQMLCKAIQELRSAEKIRPKEARPYWYLAEAFHLLGQALSAEGALRQARDRSAYSTLTEFEQRELLTRR